MTNSAVNNAFKTLAALICVQNGFDARALMLSCQEGSSNCYLTPMAAPCQIMIMGPGGYSLKDYLKCGTPLEVMITIVCIFTLPIMFPFY